MTSIQNSRAQFVAAVAAMLVGIVAVAGYGWLALREASTASDRAQELLLRIWTIEQLEGELPGLSRLGDDGIDRSVVADLDEHAAQLAAIEWESKTERALAEDVAAIVAAAGSELDPSNAQTLAGAKLSKLGKLATERSQKAVKTRSQQASRARAKSIVGLGAGVVALLAVFAVVGYVRLNRERAAAEAKLRRNDRLAALGTIAASVAHEINNPLATIAGCAASVRSRMRRGEADGEDADAYMEMIEEETRRCSGIVGSLRDLARETPVALTSGNLSAIVHEVLGLVQMNRTEARIEYDVTAPDELDLMCDPDKIKQLLLNLLLNARDACGDQGRVRILVEVAEGDVARIVVEDNGVGMDKRRLQRVFEPFHTGKTRGLGIGLFVCERIAALHGGTIGAESAGAGKGSRFQVELPRRMEPDADKDTFTIE